ncbi:MAG: hypothetical protein JEZ11_03240 [Desulfobacterales bacterium]|nr:hypothetical protein [Desulfobacterales bacterium]
MRKRSVRQIIGMVTFCIPLMLGSALPVRAAGDICGDIAENIQHGGMIWSENAVVVQGTAAPDLSDPNRPVSVIKAMSKRAATLDAYRKAAGILSGVRVTSEMIGTDNARVMSRIQAYVRHGKVCNAKFYADGGVDVVVKLPLSGAYAVSQMPAAGSREATAASPYTSVIVDASALPFAPALAPRLLSEAGTVLFDESRLSPEVIKQRGAVTFVSAPEEIDADLAGNNPLRARAVTLGTQSPSDLVLNAAAAGELAGGPSFLGQGRVVIVTGQSRRIDCRSMAGGVNETTVDWENKLVLAKGLGRVDFSKNRDDAVRIRLMERAAEVDAERRLLEAFLNLRITGKKTLGDTPGAAEHASGVIMNAMRCGAKYFRDGSAEVILAAPLDGMAVEGALLGTDRGTAAPVPAMTTVTGLVVDASGLDFEPVLAPQIHSPDGRSLYGPETVARAYVQQYGVVGYSRSLAEAQRDTRVGDRPLTVRAKRVAYYDKGILMLDSAAVARIKEILGENGPLTQGRVIIVTGTPEPQPTKTASPSPVKSGPKNYGGSSVKTEKLTF